MYVRKKLYIVPEMTFKGHSRSSAMPSFVRSLGLSWQINYLTFHQRPKM